MILSAILARFIDSKKETTDSPRGLGNALACFQAAVADTFPLGRKRIKSMIDLESVTPTHLNILFAHYGLKAAYEPEAQTWPLVSASNGLETLMRREPRLVTEAAIITALDSLRVCPGKQHHMNADLSPENDPLHYTTRIWAFLANAAEANPRVFQSDEIKEKILNCYYDEGAMRPGSASLCLTRLYFKDEVLGSRAYLESILAGVEHDAALPQGDALGGKALNNLNDYLAKDVSELTPIEWVSVRALANNLKEEDIHRLRALCEAGKTKSLYLQHAIATTLSHCLIKRPDLAQESDKKLLKLDAFAFGGFAPIKMLHLDLMLATTLTQNYPDWDWDETHDNVLKLQTRLIKPRHAIPTAMDDMSITLLEWNPNDLTTLRACQNMCNEIAKNTKPPMQANGFRQKSSQAPKAGCGN